MPYFVFKISANKQFALVKACLQYREAKDLCRTLRLAEPTENPNAVRMAFAEDEAKAKRLLLDRHQPSSPLEEWEA